MNSNNLEIKNPFEKEHIPKQKKPRRNFAIKKKPLLILMTIIMIGAIALSGFQINFGENDSIEKGVSLTSELFTVSIGFDTADAAGTPDYICDGIDDNVQYQAALDALPATGGLISARAGNYSFTSNVTRAIDNVTWIGVGQATYIALDGINPVITAGGNNWIFQDMKLDAGGIDFGATTNYQMQRCMEGATFYTYRTDDYLLTGDLEVTGVTTLTGGVAGGLNISGDATVSGSSTVGGNLGVTGTLDAITGRGVAYTIAAIDSGTLARSQADVLCSGVADEVTVRTSIVAAMLLDVGITVVLLPGSYSFSDTGGYCIEIDMSAFAHSIDIYAYGTEINYIGGAVTGVFYITGNSAQPKTIFRMHGGHINGGGLDTGSECFYIKNAANSLFEDITITGFGPSVGNYAFYVTDTAGFCAEYNTWRRCYIYDNQVGIYINAANGGASNTRIIDCIISNINVPTANSNLLVFAGLTVARSEIRNTSFHSGGASGQFGLYFLTDANGMVITSPGFDNHSAVNQFNAIKTEAGAQGTIYVIGLQGSTSGGTLVFTDVAAGSANWKIQGSNSYVTFSSGTSTGTSAEQTIPHSLDVEPGYEDITLSMNSSGTVAYNSSAPDATNIYVTSGTGTAYTWIANTEN